MRLILATFLASAAASGALAGRSDERFEVKTVIRNGAPEFEQCYQNALSGGGDYDNITPCDAALGTEALSQRKTAIVHVNRGVIFYNLGDYSSAADDFTKALDLGINVKAKVLVNRGLTFEALNEERLARRDYEAALAFNPDNRTAQRRLEELAKPLYERSRPPARINAGPVAGPSVGI